MGLDIVYVLVTTWQVTRCTSYDQARTKVSFTNHVHARCFMMKFAKVILVVYLCTNVSRKSGLKANWVRLIPAENFRQLRNIWKGSPVCPDQMFQKEIHVPFLQSHLCYQFEDFMFKTFLSVDGTTGSPSSVHNRTHYRVFWHCFAYYERFTDFLTITPRARMASESYRPHGLLTQRPWGREE